MRAILIFPVLLCAAAGCRYCCPISDWMVAMPRPVNMYVDPKTPWEAVQRVVVMPLGNQSDFPRAGAEMRAALAAELRNMGRFEIVLPPENLSAPSSSAVISSGKFDELHVLQIAREHNAQAVVFGSVTHYDPYSVPRIGLSLVMVDPYEAVVIASVEELWDAREQAVADEARAHHARQLEWPASLFALERSLESPEVFRRFAAYKVAQTLTESTHAPMLAPPVGEPPLAPIDHDGSP